MYFATNALARKMEKIAVNAWKKVDLSPSHAYLLMLALDAPGIQPMKLSEELHLEPSTITRLIEKLEEKKLLVRIADGKQTNVYPTSKARALRPKMKQCVADFYDKYSLVLGKEESDRFIKSINRMADKLAV